MYIRTKDGIHSVEAVPLSNGRIRYSLSNEDSLISKEDFEKITIREADTIEELCDMFVCGGIGFEMPSEMPLSHTTQYQKRKILIKFGMIGGLDVWLKLGIWTDKGLIYVAKMNENGELELI